MKNSLFLVVLLLVFASCGTTRQRAERHLKKAIGLDPNIIERQTVDTILTGTLTVRDTLHIKQADNQFGVDLDSIKRELSKPGANQAGTVIYQDSTRTVTVKKLPSGKLMARIENKLMKIPCEITAPYKIFVRVPGNRVNVPTDRPFWQYRWFWLLILSNVILATRYFWKTGSATSLYNKLRDFWVKKRVD